MAERLRHEVDLSIGQRLGIGLLLLLLLMLVMGGLFWDNFRESSALRQSYLDEVASVDDAVADLKIAMLRVALSVGAYQLEPVEGNVQRYRQDAIRARQELRRLEELPMDAENERRFVPLRERVDEYLNLLSGHVSRVAAGTAGAGDAAGLRARRDQLLTDLRSFKLFQDQREAEAVATLRDIEVRTLQRLLAVFGVTLALFVLLGLLMAQSIRRPARGLVAVADALRNGDHGPALYLREILGGRIARRNEMLQVATAFSAAAQSIDERERRLTADAEVSAAAAASLKREEVARLALEAVTKHAGAEVGVFYGWDEERQKLVPLATHGLADPGEAVLAGEGLPGRAALSDRAVILTDLPPDSRFQISLGYDRAPPRCAAAVAIRFQDHLQGVLLIASLRNCEAGFADFLEASARDLAVGFENIGAYERVQELLAQVGRHNERIQAQNEELQAQSEEIHAQNEELQAQQEELQAQNSQLQQQSAELLEADRRKNDFLGMLAHELRNPLAPITSCLEVLARAPSGSSESQYALTVIRRQTRHLNRLVDDLLDITRISQGKIQLQRERIDLVESVRSCLDDMKTMFEQKRLRVVLNLPQRPVYLIGDQVRLCQVVSNLLHNAAKFTRPDGRVALKLTVDPTPAGDVAEISVEDDGIGMSEELRARLFQPFSQGQSGLDRRNSGLGLGLALVRALVGQHGGSVSAYSEGEGRGSRFRVRLPVEPAGGAAPGKGEPARRHSGSGYRILVIDDNLDAARSLATLLSLAGHIPEVSHSGPDGLRRARETKPDLVLCDIGLPEMDGYEVARRFREAEATRSIPLVALTGYAMAEDRHRAYEAGFDRHEAKPFNLERLDRLLADLCPR